MNPDLTLDLSKTYIYEGGEYILTGRVAKRETDAPLPRTRRSKRVQRISLDYDADLMVEITPRPKNRSILNIPQESKWVKFRDLYAVVQVLDGDEEEENNDE
jgi:hypothetical protein